MRSLFDRISEPQATDFVSPAVIRDEEIKSIETELNRLLNTRSYIGGNTSTRSNTILDYGLDDIVSSGIKKPDRLSSVINNVRYAIETHEPRLTDIVVKGDYYNQDPTQLLLQISGKLRRTKDVIRYKVPLALMTAEA